MDDIARIKNSESVHFGEQEPGQKLQTTSSSKMTTSSDETRVLFCVKLYQIQKSKNPLEFFQFELQTILLMSFLRVSARTQCVSPSTLSSGLRLTLVARCSF